MYKIYTKKTGITTGYIRKFLLIMRLTTVVLIATFMQVSAAGFAQKISLTKTKAPLKSILKELRLQSGYDFVYSEKLLNESEPVDINVKSADIEEVLESIFNKQPLTYNIREKTVVITLKRPSLLNKMISAFSDIVVRGRVLDENSMPLPGVTVSVKGTSRKTGTNKDGLFEINAASPNDILVFTSVGMQTKEININNRTELIVSLTSISNELEEVKINTGYQLISREKMTGASATVNSTELEKRYTPNILDNLEGRVSGLVDYRGAIQIRGVGTIQAARTPLIVVDGLPIEGTIANINPYDVESITVLKDAAASAIYGVRAANGVIVVTTKRAKNKGTSVEFSSNISITEKPNISYNLLTPAQQVDLESSYYSWYFKGGNAATPAAIATNLVTTETNIRNGNPITPVQYAYYQLAKNPATFTQTQLQSQLDAFKLNDFRKQYSDNVLLENLLQQYDLAIRTKGDSFQSSLILNYKTNNTGIINAYDNQLNIFYKGTYQVSKWLDVNFGVNGVLGKAKSSASSFATSGTNVSPYLQLLDNSGNSMYYTTGDYNMYNTTAANMPHYSMLVNHLHELELDARITKQTNTRYFVNADAKILPGLTFSPQFQYENGINNVSNYSEQDSYVMRYLKNIYYKTPTTPANNPVTYALPLLPENGGKLATANATSDYWTARVQLGYKKQFGKHYIDVIAGTEFRQTLTKGTGGLLLGYDDQLQSQSTTSVNFPALFAYKTGDLNSFKPAFSPIGLYNTYLNNPINVIPEIRNRYNSNYANAIYTYDNKYNISGSYRVDYANVFGLDKKYRGKPLLATGASWNISNESFMSDVNWINFLKLRVSYGLTGNIPSGLSSQLVANSTLINAVTNLPVSVVISAANPLLRWEKSATTNLGIDFNLLNNRLSGAIEWYRKNSTDVFFRKRIDPSEGFTEQIINNASVLNKGIELSLNYSWLKAETRTGVSWSSLLILSKNSNKVTAVDEVSVTPVALAQGGYKVDYPVNSLFSFQYKGLNGVGEPQWLKADGTLTTAALGGGDLPAVVYSGGTDPKINIALTNEVYYKGFSLNVLAVYYGGHDLRTTYPDPYSNGAAYGGMPSYLLNSWTPSNTNTLSPGFGQYAPSVYPGSSAMPSNQLPYSDAFVAAGDFIKIRNVVLGYQLPRELTEKIGSKNVKLSFQLNNPKALWIKNNLNVDPETGGARTLTSYVFGVNVNL